MQYEGIDVISNDTSQSKKVSDNASALYDPSLTWDDIQWLKSITNLPVVVKGVMTAEDTETALAAGVHGIIVSNHGARQLDTVPATIDILPDVVRAARGRCEVYLDGGVRLGTDVLKAVALGAQAVFIGRPALYSLAYNGAEGVTQMLGILKDEFSSAMALAGCRCVNDIKPHLVKHQWDYLAKL